MKNNFTTMSDPIKPANKFTVNLPENIVPEKYELFIRPREVDLDTPIPYLKDILFSEKCLTLTKTLVESFESENDKKTFCGELCKRLELDRNDVATMTLVVSAAMTQLFVIDNYLGPKDNDITSRIYSKMPEFYKQLNQKYDFKSLTIDGSEIYHKSVNPWLLKLVQLYWRFLENLSVSRKLLELQFLVWKHRYLTIYLMVLLETNESLAHDLRKIQEYIFDYHVLVNETQQNENEIFRFNTIELCCELIQSSFLVGNMTASRKFFHFASEAAGMVIEHTGLLGKRTKFQQNDIPQLVVKISSTKNLRNGGIPNNNLVEYNLLDEYKADLPKDIVLDDDTLLPDVVFKSDDSQEGDSNDSLAEPGFDSQLLMLTKLEIMLRGEVMEESLKDEWTLAYLRSIIKHACTWSIKYKALALRSVVERKHMRKMERALMQMEELIKIVENPKTISSQTKAFFSVLPQSSWQIQRSLGDISFDLALFKNALEMYSRIEYWEGMIRCYCGLGQTAKAEKIIRQEIEKHETPYLYCLLGDATDDIAHYEKSWTLSNGRFARAKKSIGTYYYTKKKYTEAIENYEEALKVNPSNVSILSLLAYSCLTIERYDRAAECYRNITYLDDRNFLAWNNLSKAYIKLNQKERAWRTLQEAIKCNYEEWKIWENFMIVSIEIGALEDVISAWHRILDIKSSHKDDQILRILTGSLINVPDEKVDAEYMRILSKALKLFARLNSTTECSPRFWICYYKLLIREFDISKNLSKEQTGLKEALTKLDIDARISKITNALQRSTPVKLMTDPSLFQIPDKVSQTLDNYSELIDCYLHTLNVVGPRQEIWHQWKNFRLSTTNYTKTLQKKGYCNDG